MTIVTKKAMNERKMFTALLSDLYKAFGCYSHVNRIATLRLLRNLPCFYTRSISEILSFNIFISDLLSTKNNIDL